MYVYVMYVYMCMYIYMYVYLFTYVYMYIHPSASPGAQHLAEGAAVTDWHVQQPRSVPIYLYILYIYLMIYSTHRPLRELSILLKARQGQLGMFNTLGRYLYIIYIYITLYLKLNSYHITI